FRTRAGGGRPGETGLLRLPGAGTLPGLGTGARRLIRDLGRAHGARASRPTDRIRIAVLAPRDPLTVGAPPARPMETLARCACTSPPPPSDRPHPAVMP